MNTCDEHLYVDAVSLCHDCLYGLILEIVAERLDARDLLKQLECNHARSATLGVDNSLTCDDCKKDLTDEDNGPPPGPKKD